MTKIVGFAGRKGSGKDTASNVLVEEAGYVNVKMAGALKGMIRFYLDYIGTDPERAERLIDGDLKETPAPEFGGKTCRHAMQTLGTEWGRNLIYPDIWVDAFKKRAAQFDKVVCSDVRFPNEVETITSLNPINLILRIDRDTEKTEGSSHQSETEIDNLPVAHVIDNNHTLNDLYWSVLIAAGEDGEGHAATGFFKD